MLNRLIFITAFLFSLNIAAQIANTRSIHNLCPSLGESSGLIWLNGDWVTHNDSGGEPKLYVLDSVTGCISREVVVKNAVNTDWEALTLDDTYIYIGDFGNNSGSRTDLKILKISISDFMTLDSVAPEIIEFDYSDQTDFTPAANNTFWDCEAMVSLGDSLVLISKNWTANVSSLYSVSKTPGYYSIIESGTIITNGKVADASYSEDDNRLIILGYAVLPFTSVIDNVSSIDDVINSLTRYDYDLQVDNSIQVEGVFLISNRVFFTSENFSFGGVNLVADFGEILLPLTSLSIGEEESSLRFWQADNQLYFQNDDFQISQIELYDLKGRCLLIQDFNSHKGLINLNVRTFGMFFAKVKYQNNTIETIKLCKC